MKIFKFFVITTAIIFINVGFIFSQTNTNCFLNDFEPKTAVIPPSVITEKPTGASTVTVTIAGDTITKISKYIFGNAIAAWAGAHDNPVLVEGVQRLAPTLIRFPGGSWSNGYFWNGVPSDCPDSIYDGQTYNGTTATKIKFWGQTGVGGWQTTPDQWYALRDQVGTEGLITVNYGYARYGLSDDPVATAAHLAADWVRYDDGRTRFWEIGNENAGPWEYGWMIDTALNKDGQPQIINGQLYGKHFKVFVDSMKSAAAEIGAEIYIGGQILHFDGTNSWNIPDRDWNEGFFNEVGDTADFYVMHNYYSSSINVTQILNTAVTEPLANMNFIKQDIIDKNASPKPVAVTEYNIGQGSDIRATSYITGMQAVILFNELIKNGYGMSARWLLVTGETGLFYGGSNTNYLNHPHSEFYYDIFAQKFCGDHFISSSSNNPNIYCYTTRYNSGETSIVLVNRSTTEQIVSINPGPIGVGNNYYVYSLIGGTDNSPFSQNVYVNGNGPELNQWGPYDGLLSIPAYRYSVGNEIKVTSPGRSVQFILVDKSLVSVEDENNPVKISEFRLNQNYPNPFNPETKISYSLPFEEFVTIKVYDVLGREVTTLVNEKMPAGTHQIDFNASALSSGTYFYKMQVGDFVTSKKLILIK